MKPLALVALVVLGCGAAWAEGLVTEARAIAGRGGLLEAACPGQDDRTLPAYFSYSRRDDLHVAEAAILLPVPVADAAEVIDRVEGYPAWALTAEDGSSVLHELGFDTVTNILPSVDVPFIFQVPSSLITRKIIGIGTSFTAKVSTLSNTADAAAIAVACIAEIIAFGTSMVSTFVVAEVNIPLSNVSVVSFNAI